MPHGAWRGGCIAGLWLLPNSLQAACDQEIWQAAFSITQQGATRVGTPELPWSAWSAAWLPFAQQVLDQSAQSILECPEGSMAAVAHGLLAMDEVSEFASYESIKTLHHALQMPPLRDEMSWQDYGMLTSASLFHFMYYKWVNVPQDNDVAETAAEDVTMSPAMLRPHHEFLFRSFIGPFVASGVYDLPMTENSVFFSEAFAFASFCHLHQVDLVAESGVYKGASTEMWSLFAKEVAAVDISLTQEAEQVAERHPNVKLYTGDGQTLLPQLLRQSARAAVFIDGPKGELAIRLALSLCELPQVAFVAIHDMGPYKRELRRLGAFFFSDEDWFQAASGHLDEPFRQRPELVGGGGE